MATASWRTTPRRAARVLEPLIRGVDCLIPAWRLGRSGLAAWQLAERLGYEGILSKEHPRRSFRACFLRLVR